MTVSLDIFVNHQFVARVPAGTFRSDLAAAGYGDGHHAFFFNPFDFLSGRENLVEVRESSSSRQIVAGRQTIKTDFATSRDLFRKARLRSQLRWSVSIAPSGKQGELEFFRRVQLAAHFHNGLRILEIGPGAGYLIGHMLKRKKPFSSYLGIDLSRPLVDVLHRQFTSGKVSFLTGNADRYSFPSEFDLVIASSVCETLFPSLVPLLKNLSLVIPPGGMFAFDLVAEDDRASISRAEWQGDNYLRLYSREEIRRLLGAAGMEMLQAEIYQKAENGHRLFVTALKLPVTPKNQFLFE